MRGKCDTKSAFGLTDDVGVSQVACVELVDRVRANDLGITEAEDLGAAVTEFCIERKKVTHVLGHGILIEALAVCGNIAGELAAERLDEGQAFQRQLPVRARPPSAV